MANKKKTDIIEIDDSSSVKNRKRRNDRNHVIYMITCDVTGDTYIGITVARGRAYQKSVDIRWKGHIYHACVENRDLPLAATIRYHGPEKFSKKILAVVRGKGACHTEETRLIKSLKPTMNVVSAPKKRK